MTHDRPIKYLSRQYLKVHTDGRRGLKVRLPWEYVDSIATSMAMVGCGSRAVPRRKKSGPTVGQVGQDRTTLGANDHSRYRAGVGKLQFMINEVPETACAVKNLSRQLAGPSELDMQDLKQCVRYTLGHKDEWLFLTVQDQPRKPNEVATIKVFTCKISSKRERSKCREWRQKRTWQIWVRNIYRTKDWNSSRV